jgi:hypothetical protein
LARRAEAKFASLLRHLCRYFSLGAISDVRIHFRAQTNASKANSSIAKTNVASKMRGKS